MGYQADTIASIIDKINRQFFLPAIQRQFVWDQRHILALFDSVLRGYPIGSFLFWDLKPEHRGKWEIYRFIDQSRHGGDVRNQLANTHGVPEVTLVLDGQQRLTSFMIGLKGSYLVKKKHMRWSNPNAWTRQMLYLDVLHDPELDAEDGEMGVRYGLQFLDPSALPEQGHHWFPVGRILDFASEHRFEEFVEGEIENLPGGGTLAQSRIARLNFRSLHRAIWRNDSIAYFTETEQDYDRVLDIFVRTNSGGEPLSKSDLLLSMIVSKWSGTNAREEIRDFVESINDHAIRKNHFDKDFVMKAALVLSDLPVRYKVENFNNANLKRIEDNWPAIKSAVSRAVNLMNSFGIDRDTLTSANALIPIAYYLYQHPERTLRGTTGFDGRNRHYIRLWLTTVLLNNVFGRSTDGVLSDARAIIQAERDRGDFPLEALSAAIGRSRDIAALGEALSDTALDLRYGGRDTFLALSLLYEPEGWGSTAFHQDHIFPRSTLSDAAMVRRGYDDDRRARYREKVDSLANLQLLSEHENTSKLASDPETWLKTRDGDFRRRHMIPLDHELSLDMFEEFIAAREGLIQRRLGDLFATTAAEEVTV